MNAQCWIFPWVTLFATACLAQPGPPVRCESNSRMRSTARCQFQTPVIPPPDVDALDPLLQQFSERREQVRSMRRLGTAAPAAFEKAVVEMNDLRARMRDVCGRASPVGRGRGPQPRASATNMPDYTGNPAAPPHATQSFAWRCRHAPGPCCCGQCPNCKGDCTPASSSRVNGTPWRGGRAMRTSPDASIYDTPLPSVGAGMSEAERELIHRLLASHTSLHRSVECLPDGVRTTVTTNDEQLVPVLRQHVRQMTQRLEMRRPVRMRDPVYRDIFTHADEVRMTWKEIPGGITVTETSENSDVVSMIQAHARKVTAFIEDGMESVRPPWAGRGRGR